MLLEPFKPRSEEVEVEVPPALFCYFEDEEASDFMKGILQSLEITDTYSKFGKKLEIVSAKIGCTTLNKLAELCEVMEIHPLTLLTLAYAGDDTQEAEQLLAQVGQELKAVTKKDDAP